MHLMKINRIHNRTIFCLYLLIEGNQCDNFPKVDAYFDKRECQAKDSRGNRCYIHVSFNTKNMSCSDLWKIAYCNLNHILTEKYQATYLELLRIGLISCYKEFCHIEYLLGTHARYKYHMMMKRYFQRAGTDRVLACRIPDRPIYHKFSFIKK